MEILLNDVPLNFKLEGEETLLTVIEGLQQWCESQKLAISEIVINEDLIHYLVDEETLNGIPLSEVNTIQVRANTYVEHAYISLLECYEYTGKVIDTGENISFDDLSSVCEGLTWILEAVPQVTFILQLDINDTNMLEALKMLEIAKERLLSAIANSNEEDAIAYFNKDTVPFLTQFKGALEALITDAEMQLLCLIASNVTEENVISRLGSLKQLFPPLLALLDRIVHSLQTGNDKEAFLCLQKLTEGVGNVIGMVSAIKNAFDIDLGEVRIEERSFESVIRDLQSVLQDIIAAFSNEDFVTISDLLEYEVRERLASFETYIERIEEIVKGKLSE